MNREPKLPCRVRACLQVYVSVPPGTKGKHIQCDVTSSGMTLKLRGQQAPLIEGEFERKYVVM